VPATNLHYIEQLAATWEPKMRDAFIQAVQDLQNQVDIAALTRMLEQGNISGALAAIGIDPAHFNALVVAQQGTFNAGGLAAARAAPLLPQIGGYAVRVLFDVRNPRAEQWIRNESSQLVKDIVDDQRVMIRSRLEAGLQSGTNPRQVALELVGRIDRATGKRVGGVIGLSSNQEQWLRNYEAELASSDPAVLRRALTKNLRDKRFDSVVLRAIRDGTGIAPEMQAKMRMAYANKALKYRGDVIARNETIKALGAAQTEAYQQSIDKGHVSSNLLVKIPVTAGDERVRETHRMVPGMNPDGRKWNEPYQTPFGPQMHAPYEGEVQCRCFEKVKVSFLDAAVKKHKAAMAMQNADQ
jgi:hypothetical protein